MLTRGKSKCSEAFLLAHKNEAQNMLLLGMCDRADSYPTPTGKEPQKMLKGMGVRYFEQLPNPI